MAFAMTQLAWGVLEARSSYENAGESINVLKALKWGADYFLKAHVKENEFFGMVRIASHRTSFKMLGSKLCQFKFRDCFHIASCAEVLHDHISIAALFVKLSQLKQDFVTALPVSDNLESNLDQFGRRRKFKTFNQISVCFKMIIIKGLLQIKSFLRVAAKKST